MAYEGFFRNASDAGLAEMHKLYRCHDRLLAHTQAVLDHLTGRCRDLFNIGYNVLLCCSMI